VPSGHSPPALRKYTSRAYSSCAVVCTCILYIYAAATATAAAGCAVCAAEGRAFKALPLSSAPTLTLGAITATLDSSTAVCVGCWGASVAGCAEGDAGDASGDCTKTMPSAPPLLTRFSGTDAEGTDRSSFDLPIVKTDRAKSPNWSRIGESSSRAPCLSPQGLARCRGRESSKATKHLRQQATVTCAAASQLALSPVHSTRVRALHTLGQ
jgi:hypothetical protein